MVIGPTPPGTGVIAPATSRRLGEVDVADQPRLAVGAVDAVDADVDHRRARLDPVAARPSPAGRRRRPGCRRARQTAGKVAGARMGDRHRAALARAAAAPSACRRCSSGRPPPRRCPARSPSRSRSSIRQPSGVQGTIALLPGGEPADVDDVEAVDVLRRVDRVEHPAASICAGSGSCTRMPWTAGSRVQPVDQGQELGLRRSASAAGARRSACPPRAVCLPLLRT